MVDSVTPTSGGSSTTSGAEGAGNTPEKINASTTFSSMGDLKRKDAKLHRIIMEGVAMTICNKMKRNQENLKKIMREGRRSAGIS